MNARLNAALVLFLDIRCLKKRGAPPPPILGNDAGSPEVIRLQPIGVRGYSQS